ncbi:MAG: hypothetical protein RMJ31_03840 [Nitrososphaerota archaeon]|nr:hypothetical protein [Nitrososphaerota archaeon]
MERGKIRTLPRRLCLDVRLKVNVEGEDKTPAIANERFLLYHCDTSLMNSSLSKDDRVKDVL